MYNIFHMSMLWVTCSVNFSGISLFFTDVIKKEGFIQDLLKSFFFIRTRDNSDIKRRANEPKKSQGTNKNKYTRHILSL